MGTQQLEVGAVITSPEKKMSIERLWTFSGGPFTFTGWPKRNTHTDAELARESLGVSREIASATQFQGHAASLLIDVFGEDWLRSGKMDVKFIRAVRRDDTVRIELTLQEKVQLEDGSFRYVFDVRCLNQDDQECMVGTAEGILGG